MTDFCGEFYGPNEMKRW